MRILVTNDDGIKKPGIEILANWAKRLGQVTVVAPKVEQSAKSHSINIHTPFEAKKISWLEGIDCYSVDSAPADCVRFAYNGLNLQFDLVLSGINRGFNVGEDIAYSGTDAAIFEAAYFNCKAIAFSTVPETFQWTTPACLDSIYTHILDHHYFDHNLIYNVNIPTDPKTILLTKQGNAYYKDMFSEVKPGMYLACGYSMYDGGDNLDEDLDAVMNGYISITPLSVNRTAVDAYRRLRQLEPSDQSSNS